MHFIFREAGKRVSIKTEKRLDFFENLALRAGTLMLSSFSADTKTEN